MPVVGQEWRICGTGRIRHGGIGLRHARSGSILASCERGPIVPDLFKGGENLTVRSPIGKPGITIVGAASCHKGVMSIDTTSSRRAVRRGTPGVVLSRSGVRKIGPEDQSRASRGIARVLEDPPWIFVVPIGVFVGALGTLQ